MTITYSNKDQCWIVEGQGPRRYIICEAVHRGTARQAWAETYFDQLNEDEQ